MTSSEVSNNLEVPSVPPPPPSFPSEEDWQAALARVARGQITLDDATQEAALALLVRQATGKWSASSPEHLSNALAAQAGIERSREYASAKETQKALRSYLREVRPSRGRRRAPASGDGSPAEHDYKDRGGKTNSSHGVFVQMGQRKQRGRPGRDLLCAECRSERWDDDTQTWRRIKGHQRPIFPRVVFAKDGEVIPLERLRSGGLEGGALQLLHSCPACWPGKRAAAHIIAPTGDILILWSGVEQVLWDELRVLYQRHFGVAWPPWVETAYPAVSSAYAPPTEDLSNARFRDGRLSAFPGDAALDAAMTAAGDRVARGLAHAGCGSVCQVKPPRVVKRASRVRTHLQTTKVAERPVKLGAESVHDAVCSGVRWGSVQSMMSDADLSRQAEAQQAAREARRKQVIPRPVNEPVAVKDLVCGDCRAANPFKLSCAHTLSGRTAKKAG